MKELKANTILYHGSYCIVREPDLNKCAKYKDFGQGFYLTTSKRQANNFAKISTYKAIKDGLIPENTQSGYISCFKAGDMSNLSLFIFDTANTDWLHCVVSHRRKHIFSDIRKLMEAYDIVAGKIANDDTNTTINAYMGNVFGKMGNEAADKMCISLLLPERLKDQFCFRTQKAISTLQFLNSIAVTLE